MKIGIDARLYFQTGVGVYLRNLLKHLQESDTQNDYYIYVLKRDADKVSFKNKKFIKREVDAVWHSLEEQTNFLKEINKDELDLMHFTYFGFPIRYRRKFIATIHDLTPLFFKTGVSTRNNLVYGVKYLAFKHLVLSAQVKNSVQIITPTKTVKEQLVETYGQEYEKKITPIYEGVSYDLISAQENKKLADKYKDFFLYVSNFYPHKNAEKLIRAFAKLKTDKKLVMVGPNDFFAKNMKKLVEELNLTNRILFHHNPQIGDFVFFYKNAIALVHPSLSEGFGLPIVESIYFNLSIIASNIKVFEEILEDKYLKFDPNNVDDITAKLNQFLAKPMKADYGNLIDKYSFEKMAKETLEIYKTVL